MSEFPRCTGEISGVERLPELEVPPAAYRLVALFPEVPPCPISLCFLGSGPQKFAMKLTAYCETAAACDLAEKAIRTMRRW